ncbi:hypothetical protein [Streptomyces rimosus]|uniref:hypothetical protein n=1 Tax=Streptomyces rimosus TaxID=1927 RepID=UPI000AB5D955|nr:hypothetical protein [Streptomyces rimosus]
MRRGPPPAHGRAPAAARSTSAVPAQNAEAHRAIGSTYRESCGHLGHDVENYAIAAPPSRYRSRCPACGDEKKFSFTM